jgi:TetR/AcrR family transcriptional regulator, tetracycline repressor protein
MDGHVKATQRRRPRGSLSRDQIVETALRMADEQGIEGLSMPKLARQLNCGVMTIYGYISSKEELITAAAQRGLADLHLPAPLPHSAEDILIAWGRALRGTLLEHPSLPTIFLSQVVMGPGILKGIEALLTALAGAGLPARSGIHAIYAVLVHTTGFVAWELPRVRQQPPEAYATQWLQTIAALPAEQYPQTHHVVNDLPQIASDKQFDIGLTALADGLITGRDPGQI